MSSWEKISHTSLLRHTKLQLPFFSKRPMSSSDALGEEPLALEEGGSASNTMGSEEKPSPVEEVVLQTS